MKKLILIGLIVVLCDTFAYAQKNRTSDYNLKKAVELVENEDYTQAIKHLNLQLNNTPNNADALVLRAYIYRHQNNNGLALSDLNQAIQYYKKGTRFPLSSIYSLRAKVYCDLEQADKAIADYDKAYKLALKDAKDDIHDILYARAQIYYEQKAYDRANDDYQLMLKHNEADQVAMIGLARNLIAQKKYNEALVIVNNCEKFDADFEEIYRFRMQIHDKTGEVKKAIDDAILYFDKAEEPNQDLIEGVLKKHFDYSLAKLATIINVEPNNADWRLLRTSVYEWQGNYIAAINEYNALEKDFGASTSIYYHRSNAYDEIGEMKNAVNDITKCIEMGKGGDFYSINRRADYYRSGGNYQQAIIDYSKGIELEPTIAYSYYGRGWCYELSGNDEEAMKDYNQGIAMDQDYPYIYLMRGTLYKKKGNEELANRDFRQVIAKDTIPTNGSCRHYALNFLGKQQEAIDWIEAIINENPNGRGNYYDMACLYARMNRLEDALNALKQAFERGYKKFAHIEHDDDLDSLRELPAFVQLLELYKPKEVEAKQDEQNTKVDVIFEVVIKKMYSGVYEVDCTVNSLPLRFIFDTGASTVTISSVEANFMLKNGYLSNDDILGKELFFTASGDVKEGTTIRLREINIGGVILRNTNASVVNNQRAPLLLGQSILEKFGTITIDNINSKLVIKQ